MGDNIGNKRQDNASKNLNLARDCKKRIKKTGENTGGSEEANTCESDENKKRQRGTVLEKYATKVVKGHHIERNSFLISFKRQRVLCGWCLPYQLPRAPLVERAVLSVSQEKTFAQIPNRKINRTFPKMSREH